MAAAAGMAVETETETGAVEVFFAAAAAVCSTALDSNLSNLV